jgi:hypothetical protein
MEEVAGSNPTRSTIVLNGLASHQPFGSRSSADGLWVAMQGQFTLATDKTQKLWLACCRKIALATNDQASLALARFQNEWRQRLLGKVKAI